MHQSISFGLLDASNGESLTNRSARSMAAAASAGMDFSSLEDLPFWSWVNAVAKGNGGPLDIAVDRVNKTA
ncbi:hypothetical protein, partial [Eubacterium callanderi]|uniref:hypothetical protein n=1 Tax=Eubacterium callanderi TaxID=53442 RepID=UPI002108B7B8